MRVVRIALAVTVVSLAFAPAVLAQGAGAQAKMSGEIVEVQQQTRLGNQGEETQIRIQTRNQGQHWLRLGPSDEYGNRVQVGDQVRVRVMYMREGEPPVVQTMHNFRSGERIRIRDGSGELVRNQQQNRIQSREGERVRTRDRVHQPAERGGGGSGRGRRGGGGRG